MIIYLKTTIWQSPAQTLVNPVNTSGVMGAGLAREFKYRFPEMHRQYQKLCNEGKFKIGSLFFWRDPLYHHCVLNFPTKDYWGSPSKIEYIEKGLQTFKEEFRDWSIFSISFPQLGTGLGGLPWAEVKPVMEKYLDGIGIPVYIHIYPSEKDHISFQA